MRIQTFEKDPDAVVDFKWEWRRWLDGDTIATHDVDLLEGNVTVNGDSHDATSVTVFVSGGTVGVVSVLQARITTAQGRTDDRSFYLHVRNR